MASILHLTNIVKSFGTKRVLNILDFSVSPNQIVAIIGKSGCGKTTLLNILGLLDREYSGSYRFNGLPIPRRGFDSFRGDSIGFVFQSYYLINSLSVTQNIELPLKYGHISEIPDPEWFNKIAERLLIPDLLDSPISVLSGGEKQRIAIARAVIKSPFLILCDEPTGNLDSENAKTVYDVFLFLKNSGHAVVVVTHDLEIAKKCDTAYELRDGELHEISF